MAQLDYQTLLALIAKQGFDSSEFVRSAVRHAYQELIDAGLAENIGAKPHERNGERRNRLWRLAQAHPLHPGEIALPKLRQGSY